MILADKINELKELLTKAQDLVEQAKELQGDLIENAIDSVKNELEFALKNELSSDLSSQLNENITQGLNARANRQILNEIFVDNVENNPFVINRILALAEFDEKLANKIKEEVSIYENTFLRYQNAHSVLAVCLQNELALISEAYKNVAAIELYEERLTSGKPIHKTYHEI